jgi:hypothetical protein
MMNPKSAFAVIMLLGIAFVVPSLLMPLFWLPGRFNMDFVDASVVMPTLIIIAAFIAVVTFERERKAAGGQGYVVARLSKHFPTINWVRTESAGGAVRLCLQAAIAFVVSIYPIGVLVWVNSNFTRDHTVQKVAYIGETSFSVRANGGRLKTKTFRNTKTGEHIDVTTLKHDKTSRDAVSNAAATGGCIMIETSTSLFRLGLIERIEPTTCD